MNNFITVEQPPVAEVALLPWVTEEILAKEPSLRRASPEFAYKYGGSVVRAVIDVAENTGNLASNSVVMVQKSTFVPGFYPIQPEWHFDYTPSRPPTHDNATFEPAIYDSKGLVMCAYDTAEHTNDSGTLFLQGGSVTLDLDERRPGMGGRKKVSQHRRGTYNWYHSSVQAQIYEDDSLLQAVATRPNVLHAYTSRNLHFASLMRSAGGTRAVVRINTPVDETVKIKIKNTFYLPAAEPKNIFRADGPDHWIRDSIA